MKKYEITDFDFCIEEEDTVDFVIESDDLIDGSVFDDFIKVDGSVFDDFEKYSIVKIMFSDEEDNAVFEYQMLAQDPETRDITMEYFDSYSVDSAIEDLNNKLRMQHVGMIIDVPDDAYDDVEGYIAEQISDRTGWLVNRFNAIILEENDEDEDDDDKDEHLSLKGQMAKCAQPDPLDAQNYASATLEVEVCSDGIIYISHNGSSGAKYEGTTPEDIGYAVQCYVEDYL